jgi:hypothetical protein
MAAPLAPLRGRLAFWWNLTRQLVLFGLGVSGLIYEHYSPGTARPGLLATDLILIGLAPIDGVLTAWTERLRSPPP